ncbi:MAG: hypothetical protein Q9209_002617 [Squamulea sp. 1 TL-2023]
MPTATRSSHGIAATRIPFIPTTDPEQRQTTTKKKSSTAATATKRLKSAAAKAATGGTKANTSKPRVRKSAAPAGDKTTTGRVTKKAATPKTKKAAATTKRTGPKTVNQREPSLLDKVVGVKDKIVGAIEGKPGKKAAGTKKIKGTDGKGATRAKKQVNNV